MSDALPFASLWKALRERSLDEERRFWDERADEFNILAKDSSREEAPEILDLLDERGALAPHHAVLDLGCGPGRFALEFAPRCRSVTGLDISPRMIERAKANARERKLDNLAFITASWQEFDLQANGFEGAFDLVFASMTPAVDSAETLLKMHAASRGRCFLSGYIERRDLLLEALAARLAPGLAVAPHRGGIWYAFNILWQHGIYADCQCVRRVWHSRLDPAKAAGRYAGPLAKLMPDRDDLEGRLAEALAAMSQEDGAVQLTMQADCARLFWQRKR